MSASPRETRLPQSGCRAALRGDRHLRPDAGRRLLEPSHEVHQSVRLTGAPDAVASPAGQHALWMLANLLARQFAVIHELVVAVPEHPLLPGIAHFGRGATLSQTLEMTARVVAGDDMKVRAVSPEVEIREEANVEICVGDSAAPLGPARRFVRVAGAKWVVTAGDAVSKLPREWLADGNPCGPYFAACIGAGEVFKQLRGLRPGKGEFIRSLSFSLWDFNSYDSPVAAPDGIAPAGMAIPSFYLIGAGAVGQAVAATLATCQVRGHATVIDHDLVDESNANRYPLVVDGDNGKAKAGIVAEVLRQSGMSVFPHRGRWPNYAYELPHHEQPADLQALEAQYKYELVLSCVDRNRDRHAIQRFWPRQLLGGSTDDLLVQVTTYDMRMPYECLMCGNPPDADVLTIEAVASELRRLSPEERQQMLRSRGLDVEAVEQYLSQPKCGELGEQELSKFAEGSVVDWAAGFVSVAAGVLLVTQLLKLASGGASLEMSNERGSTLRFSFLRPGPRSSVHLRRRECTCITEGRVTFSDLWGASVTW